MTWTQVYCASGDDRRRHSDRGHRLDIVGEGPGGGDGDWWRRPMVPILTCRMMEGDDKKAGGCGRQAPCGKEDSWDPPDGNAAAVTGRPQVLPSSPCVVALFP